MLLVCHCGLDPQSPDKGNFKATYAERRITLITPCKRSAARGKGCRPHLPELRIGVQPATGLIGKVLSSYPELRFACTGLSICKTYGLLFEAIKIMRDLYRIIPRFLLLLLI